jgi:seryl-tRNA synthetase
MLDLAALRTDTESYRQAWNDRGVVVDVAGLIALDERVRHLKHRSETLKAEANAASKQISQAARSGQDVQAAKDQARALGDESKRVDEERVTAEQELASQLLLLPNICLPGVPVGKDANANRVDSTWGAPPSFAFTAKPHWDLGPQLGIMDFDRATKLSGSGFVVLKGQGARLSRALISWFLDMHTREHGYTELAVPYLVQSQMMVGTAQLPKFADQSYRCRDDELWLIPTAEVPVTNLHAGEILESESLPIRYTAHTPCFRREAGAAGVGTRGMTRVHQFDKVEMVWLTVPERSQQDLLTMRGHAERLLRDLGLHYRVLELCTGDTGFGSAHTYDLEVWSPGTNTWLEVSSCSIFTDFQARRANLRYREKGGKPRFMHTLNGSGLALPRTMIALLETYQQPDGGVILPQVLAPYLGDCHLARPLENRKASS